ncbi:unnamed protein product [Citrullus colocynthis]|uniref:Uncharacterized protein n=1 Tax=Citrullus colocynthis TaxID=252529 RepID=A0ABP0XQW3_9ROSI
MAPKSESPLVRGFQHCRKGFTPWQWKRTIARRGEVRVTHNAVGKSRRSLQYGRGSSTLPVASLCVVLPSVAQVMLGCGVAREYGLADACGCSNNVGDEAQSPEMKRTGGRLAA